MTDLGVMEYQKAHRLQQRIAEARIRKQLKTDVLLILEHFPVFTLGKRGGAENLRVSRAFLGKKGISVIPTRRGGNITYHGPGQLVLYLILDLSPARMGVAELVNTLEEIMILTCRDFAVFAERNRTNHGIWVGGNKIGSIGLSVRHGVCRHGLALNVNLDLTPFSWIHPCGLTGVNMTSMALEQSKQNRPADAGLLPRVKRSLIRHLEKTTGSACTSIDPSFLAALIDTSGYGPVTTPGDPP